MTAAALLSAGPVLTDRTQVIRHHPCASPVAAPGIVALGLAFSLNSVGVNRGSGPKLALSDNPVT